MMQKFIADHRDDENGNPAGGTTVVLIAEGKKGGPTKEIELDWQDGPLGRDGERLEPNGLFVETLIAVAADRIRYYQSKKFACRENAIAVTKLEEALHWLQARTARREAAAIEGTHEVDETEAKAAVV